MLRHHNYVIMSAHLWKYAPPQYLPVIMSIIPGDITCITRIIFGIQ
jgi:hypothetical protein